MHKHHPMVVFRTVSVLAALVLTLTSCGGGSIPGFGYPEAELKGAIDKEIETGYYNPASYKIVSAMKAPNPDAGIFQLYKVDEVWCVKIDPPLLDPIDEPNSHMLVTKQGLLYKLAQRGISDEDGFLIYGCDNY